MHPHLLSTSFLKNRQSKSQYLHFLTFPCFPEYLQKEDVATLYANGPCQKDRAILFFFPVGAQVQKELSNSRCDGSYQSYKHIVQPVDNLLTTC